MSTTYDLDIYKKYFFFKLYKLIPVSGATFSAELMMHSKLSKYRPRIRGGIGAPRNKALVTEVGVVWRGVPVPVTYTALRWRSVTHSKIARVSKQVQAHHQQDF